MRFKTIMAVIIIGVLMISQVMPQKTDLKREGDKYVARINKEYSAKPGGKLKIFNVSGDITVSSWNNNQVKISENLQLDVYTAEEAQKVYEKVLAGYQQTGNDVIIEGLEKKNWIKRNFEINVPREFNLDLQTSGGDMKITAMKGTIELKTSGGDIQILDANGNIAAKTSGGDLKLEKIEGILDAKTSGGDVDLIDLSGTMNIKTSGGDITLVGGKKEIDLKTSGGSISVKNVAGTLSAKTSGGDIQTQNCEGNITLQTSGGDITLQNLKGTIEAGTSGGDIEGNALLDSVMLHTSGGNIQLKDIQGVLDAKTSGGDIDVEITTTDFTKPHSVQLHTSGGDIDLTLPAKIPATILAEIILGRSSQLKQYDISSDFPLTKNKVEENGNQIIRSQGEINGGGDQILLKTSGGNIRIHKK